MAKITNKGMQAKPKKNDQWITDPSPRGTGTLRGRITPAGARLFYFRYTGPGGKREHIPLGSYASDGKGGLTVAEARERAGELSRLYQGGAVDLKGYLLKQAEGEKIRLEAERMTAEREAKRETVKTLFERWQKAQLRHRKDGGKEVTRLFTKDVLPVMGDMRVEDVRKAHVADVVDTILTRGAARTAKIVLASMRQMFCFAVERDLIPADPTAGIKKSKIGGQDTERDRVLSDDEIATLAASLPSSGLLPTTQAAVWICLSTCCRIGELLNARWEHLDTDRKTWLIPAENSKNGKALEIHLSDFALHQFEVIKAATTTPPPWMYPNRDHQGPVCSKSITKQLGDRQRTGEPKHNKSKGVGTLALPGGKWTPHDLRRTGATIMTALGVLPEVAERCLNHTEQNRIKRVYQRHSYAPEMRRAWELLGERLEALTTGKVTAKVLTLHVNQRKEIGS